MEKIGRKKSTALSLLIGGGCCLISSAFVGHQNSAAKTIMTITFLLGKLGVTWTFGNIYIYTSGNIFSNTTGCLIVKRLKVHNSILLHSSLNPA